MVIALGVSVAVAVTSYALPHTAAAALSGVGGACAAVAVQAGAWVKRNARRVSIALA
ncbi:hypothetical protein [Limnoglobus roseus]|uniref:Uncharacterized protein n=1 Tax=Limnoglobus roseus TaxID=2598579 RepID=A0A5C1AGC2_9BACT|nr:hypothetical protein [Limnoglobus roseus]QEL16792.1 hypothetical protein PX52LOC_03765 [Limnoglobus roseus]